MKNSKTVLIDKNPGRNSQSFGIARELGTDINLIHEPSIGVVGNKGDSQCYMGVTKKVNVIQEVLLDRVGVGPGKLSMRLIQVAVRSENALPIDPEARNKNINTLIKVIGKTKEFAAFTGPIPST